MPLILPQNLAEEVVVGGDGQGYFAPLGTPLPDDIGEQIGDGLDADFGSLGYTNEDGVKFGVTRTIKDINGWQSYAPLRKIVTGYAAKATTNLMQANANTLPFAYGGGVITSTPNGALYTPAAPGELSEFSMVWDIEDGEFLHRIVIDRGMNTGDIDTSFTRNDAATFGISFEALAQTLSTTPWRWYTNNVEAFLGAGS